MQNGPKLAVFNTQELTLSALTDQQRAHIDNIHWQQPTTPTVEDASAVALLQENVGINWERLLIDLHSGRALGSWGGIFVDILALLLALIACGGVWIWITKPGRFKRSD